MDPRINIGGKDSSAYISPTLKETDTIGQAISKILQKLNSRINRLMHRIYTGEKVDNASIAKLKNEIKELKSKTSNLKESFIDFLATDIKKIKSKEVSEGKIPEGKYAKGQALKTLIQAQDLFSKEVERMKHVCKELTSRKGLDIAAETVAIYADLMELSNIVQEGVTSAKSAKIEIASEPKPQPAPARRDSLPGGTRTGPEPQHAPTTRTSTTATTTHAKPKPEPQPAPRRDSLSGPAPQPKPEPQPTRTVEPSVKISSQEALQNDRAGLKNLRDQKFVQQVNDAKTEADLRTVEKRMQDAIHATSNLLKTDVVKGELQDLNDQLNKALSERRGELESAAKPVKPEGKVTPPPSPTRRAQEERIVEKALVDIKDQLDKAPTTIEAYEKIFAEIEKARSENKQVKKDKESNSEVLDELYSRAEKVATQLEEETQNIDVLTKKASEMMTAGTRKELSAVLKDFDKEASRFKFNTVQGREDFELLRNNIIAQLEEHPKGYNTLDQLKDQATQLSFKVLNESNGKPTSLGEALRTFNNVELADLKEAIENLKEGIENDSESLSDETITAAKRLLQEFEDVRAGRKAMIKTQFRSAANKVTKGFRQGKAAAREKQAARAREPKPQMQEVGQKLVQERKDWAVAVKGLFNVANHEDALNKSLAQGLFAGIGSKGTEKSRLADLIGKARSLKPDEREELFELIHKGITQFTNLGVRAKPVVREAQDNEEPAFSYGDREYVFTSSKFKRAYDTAAEASFRLKEVETRMDQVKVFDERPKLSDRFKAAIANPPIWVAEEGQGFKIPASAEEVRYEKAIKNLDVTRANWQEATGNLKEIADEGGELTRSLGQWWKGEQSENNRALASLLGLEDPNRDQREQLKELLKKGIRESSSLGRMDNQFKHGIKFNKPGLGDAYDKFMHASDLLDKAEKRLEIAKDELEKNLNTRKEFDDKFPQQKFLRDAKAFEEPTVRLSSKISKPKVESSKEEGDQPSLRSNKEVRRAQKLVRKDFKHRYRADKRKQAAHVQASAKREKEIQQHRQEKLVSKLEAHQSQIAEQVKRDKMEFQKSQKERMNKLAPEIEQKAAERAKKIVSASLKPTVLGSPGAKIEEMETSLWELGRIGDSVFKEVLAKNLLGDKKRVHEIEHRLTVFNTKGFTILDKEEVTHNLVLEAQQILNDFHELIISAGLIKGKKKDADFIDPDSPIAQAYQRVLDAYGAILQ